MPSDTTDTWDQFSTQGTWHAQKTGNLVVNDSSYLLQFKTDR